MRFPECKDLLDTGSHSLSKAVSSIKPGYEVFKALSPGVSAPSSLLGGLSEAGSENSVWTPTNSEAPLMMAERLSMLL